MLSDFFDENKSEGEIAVLEQNSQSLQTSETKYSFNWPEAGVGKRITGITGEKVSSHIIMKSSISRCSSHFEY